MLEQLQNGNLKDAQSGALSNDVASVKMGGADNKAYGGVPQADDPSLAGRGFAPVGDEEHRSAIVGYLANVFERAKSARSSNRIDEDLLQCLRQFRSQYSAEDISAFRAKGYPEVYFPLSRHKANTAIAWIDEFFTNPEQLVNIRPTPVPEMETTVVARCLKETLEDVSAIVRQTGQIPPPEMIEKYAAMKRPLVEQTVGEEALAAAAKMERTIRDDLVQGDWAQRISELIGFTCIYGTAALRAPVLRIRRGNVWKNGKVAKADRLVRTFESVSPFDLFPAPGATSTQDGDLCVRVAYDPGELASFKGVKPWIDAAIERALIKYGESGHKLDAASDSERETLTRQEGTGLAERGSIEGFEFWGSVSGRMLNEIGISDDGHGNKIAATDTEWHDVNAIVIGDELVYCRIMAKDEDRPLDVVKFFDTPGSFWGESPLHVIAANQRTCNAAARSLIVNMAFCASPQSIVDTGMLDPRDDGKARPGKTWFVKRTGLNQNAGDPVKFFNVDSNAILLMKVFDFFQRLADEVSGIPAYANGTDAMAGAGRTATGLQMLMGSANRGIKKVVGNIDRVTRQAVARLVRWHMEFNEDAAIKGDIFVEVTGLKYFVTKTARANDILNLITRVGQDQRLSSMQAPEQLAKLLREVAIAYDLPPETLAPTAEEIRLRMEEERQQAMAAKEEQARMAEEKQGRDLEQIAAEGEAKAMARHDPEGAPQQMQEVAQ